MFWWLPAFSPAKVDHNNAPPCMQTSAQLVHFLLQFGVLRTAQLQPEFSSGSANNMSTQNKFLEQCNFYCGGRWVSVRKAQLRDRFNPGRDVRPPQSAGMRGDCSLFIFRRTPKFGADLAAESVCRPRVVGSAAGVCAKATISAHIIILLFPQPVVYSFVLIFHTHV